MDWVPGWQGGPPSWSQSILGPAAAEDFVAGKDSVVTYYEKI